MDRSKRILQLALNNYYLPNQEDKQISAAADQSNIAYNLNHEGQSNELVSFTLTK